MLILRIITVFVRRITKLPLVIALSLIGLLRFGTTLALVLILGGAVLLAYYLPAPSSVEANSHSTPKTLLESTSSYMGSARDNVMRVYNSLAKRVSEHSLFSAAKSQASFTEQGEYGSGEDRQSAFGESRPDPLGIMAIPGKTAPQRSQQGEE